MAGWPDIVEDLNGDEWGENRATFERTAPYLIGRGAMTDILRSAGRMQRLPPAPASDVSRLLEDPEFIQILSWRVNNLENVLLEVETVGRSIDRILHLLQGG